MPWWNDVTKEYISRASPSDMTKRFGGAFVDGNGHAQTTGDWNWDSDVSAVAGQPTKWWTGTITVTLISQAAQDVITVQELSDARDSKANRFDDVENDLRQVVKLTIDQVNDHSLKINGILDAIDGASNLGEVKSAIGAIDNLSPITFAQAKTKIRDGWGT